MQWLMFSPSSASTGRGRGAADASSPTAPPACRLRLRIGETGAKHYVVRYRVDGRQRRVTIGSAAVLTLAEARARARKLVDQAKAGIDPAETRRARHQNSVAAVVEEYAERHLRRNLRSGAQAEARLRRDVVAAWGERPIQSVTKADVVRLIDSIHDRAPVSANRTLQLLKALLSWCVKRSILEVNAAAGVDLPHRERPRERTLNEDEIRAAWSAFTTMGYPVGDLARLLLLTGARRSEWAGAAWGEIDFERQLWRLPPGRSKTGEELVRPLVPAALAILGHIPRVDGSDLVFPATGSLSRALATVHRLSARRAGVARFAPRRALEPGPARRPTGHRRAGARPRRRPQDRADLQPLSRPSPRSGRRCCCGVPTSSGSWPAAAKLR